MKFLALLSSMPFESDTILDCSKHVRTDIIAGKQVYKAKFAGVEFLICNTGIGKVNAAHSATFLIENFPIGLIINFGIGGAYPGSGLQTGNLAISSKEIYGDEGVITSTGWDGMKEIGIPLVQTGGKKYFNEYRMAPGLAGKTRASLKRITHHAGLITKVKPGNFVTVSAVSGSHKRAVELEKRFNAVCENMEGAAVAHVCTIYKIPMLELRGISNIVGIRDKAKWDLTLASENCQRAALEVIKNVI
ncbi:MAG: futalosine hydrolase [Nitrospirae bacterium]|nr:futalosine hydrolase [Nitrospirota bacterium]